MHRSTRRPLASVARGAPRAVGLLVGAGVPRPPTAHADSVGCRADPGVLLSDGTVVDFSAAIAAAAADVRGGGGPTPPPRTPRRGSASSHACWWPIRAAWWRPGPPSGATGRACMCASPSKVGPVASATRSPRARRTAAPMARRRDDSAPARCRGSSPAASCRACRLTASAMAWPRIVSSSCLLVCQRR